MLEQGSEDGHYVVTLDQTDLGRLLQGFTVELPTRHKVYIRLGPDVPVWLMSVVKRAAEYAKEGA